MKKIWLDRRYKLGWMGYSRALVYNNFNMFTRHRQIAEQKFSNETRKSWGRDIPAIAVADTLDKRLNQTNYYIGFLESKDLTMFMLMV